MREKTCSNLTSGTATKGRQSGFISLNVYTTLKHTTPAVI